MDLRCDVVLGIAVPAQARTPTQNRRSRTNKEGGKYAFSRQKAEAKHALTGDGAARTAAQQKCLNKCVATTLPPGRCCAAMPGRWGMCIVCVIAMFVDAALYGRG